MNDIWGLLEIDPTDDKKAIRKAFAAQSKLHHPEEEPEYFAALNQAYKAALDHGAKAEGNAVTLPFASDVKEEKKTKYKETLQVSGQKEAEDQGRNIIQEKTQEEGERSLLKLLDEAAKQAVKASLETGALHAFITLFENLKQAKQADTWKRFFLSETFLKEQFSEEFGKGLLAYLSGQTLWPGDNLPVGFLQELAIAYAFIPHFAGEEYFDGLKYPKEWYKVSVENTFPGRKYAAEIFNMQGRDCDLKSMTGRMLRQPASKVRHNAFSDYIALKEMSRDGRLTDGEKETWQHILGVCQPFYLYERNGRQIGSGGYEARSECVVKLYVQWIKDEQVPAEVLLFLYKKLDFKDLNRSSTKGLYSALKEEVLRQLPQAEEILFGEDGKEQRITKLYRIYSSIINDNENNYDKFIYEETPEIRDRAKAFFALPEWELLKEEKGLFERIYSVSKRIVMPRTLAKTLAGYLAEGDYPEPERTELTESLLRSISTEKMCRELDYRCEISLASTDPEDIGDSPDFWQYFLMRGFGFRHEKIRGSWEEDYIYVMDGQCYLPAYINYIYAPSRAWQRRFTGFDEETEEIEVPVDIVCSMPGNRKLKVEFHYHYCLYFVDGVKATAPVLSFSQLQEYADSLKKPEDFFFLLAVTAIEDSDRNAAQRLIESWLKRIPIHPFIIPTITRMLAADNDRISMALSNPKGTSCAVQSENNVEAVFYDEQERFCFRAAVSETGFIIWHQMDYGWQDIIFRSAKLGWRKYKEYTWEEYRLSAARTDTPEGRKAAALKALHGLRQPKPPVCAVYSLEGMDMAQKAVKILAAMGFPESMEGYCLLRYGAKKEKHHDRVFYGARAPFGFQLKVHSTAYERSREYLMSSSNRKIKEPKILVGRFGWGFKYAPRSDYGPIYVYQGESGKFYAYGTIRMHRADSLDQLLADIFQEEWEGVTEAAVYEECLTVSRLDHRLEYCYTKEDMRQSMHSPEDTAADRFTLFGGYGMWMEFSRWMDGMLNMELPLWVNAIVVGLDWEKGGALTFAGIHEEDDYAEEDDYEEENYAEEDYAEIEESEEKIYVPQAPLLVWAKGMDQRDRAAFLADALQWYVDCGKFAEKIGDRNIRILVKG